MVTVDVLTADTVVRKWLERRVEWILHTSSFTTVQLLLKDMTTHGIRRRTIQCFDEG